MHDPYFLFCKTIGATASLNTSTDTENIKTFSDIYSTCKQIFPDISNIHFPPLSVKTNNLKNRYFIRQNSFIKTGRINFKNFYSLVSFLLEPTLLLEAKYSCTYRTFQILKPQDSLFSFFFLELSRYKQTLVAFGTGTEGEYTVVCTRWEPVTSHIYLSITMATSQLPGQLKPDKSFLNERV